MAPIMMTAARGCGCARKVGTANTINTLTNLSRDRVPLMTPGAGRTPMTEKGEFGSPRVRSTGAGDFYPGLHSARAVKWDYELRMPGQIGEVVRAREVTIASPRGPVFWCWPRRTVSRRCPSTSPAQSCVGAFRPPRMPIPPPLRNWRK